MKEKLINNFKEIFKEDDKIRTFFAPGRVNLIGEHVDYNGGNVFPCALNIGTYGVVRKRNDNKLRFYSENFKELGIVESSIEDLKWEQDANWTNYPKGVIWAFLEKGYKIETGFDVLIYGNIPNGSGLSSSASVEVLTGTILKSLFNIDVSMEDIALISQYSENVFNKVNCGIMDQFIIAMGKKDKAIMLNTDNLSFEYVSIELKDEKIIIINSNKKRALGESKYNQRRAECEEALNDLKYVVTLDNLCDLNVVEFEKYKSFIENDTARKRAKHVIYENDRTILANQALKKGDIITFGRLMNESHISLRDDYEVTGFELDTLAELAWKEDGVIGSRMTGAGFGGCTVSIVKNENVYQFIENIKLKYNEITGLNAEFYVVEIGDGSREI